MQRRKLELLESEYELKQIKDKSELERFNLNKKLLEKIWSYDLVDKRLSDFETFGKDINYSEIEEYLVLIKYLSELRKYKNEIYLDCINTYIDLLALSQKLSASPFVNYISADLRPFSFDHK